MYLTRVSEPADFSYNIQKVLYGADDTPDINLAIPHIVPHEIGFMNNTYYFPIDQIMDFLGFFLAGDESEPLFVRRNPAEDLKLRIGTNIVYINGARRHLMAPSFMADGDIYVPLESILNIFENISLDDGDILLIKQNAGPYFRINAVAAMLPIDETTPANALFLAQHGTNLTDFLSDLSAFEQYFNPPYEEIGEYLILINQTNPLSSDFFPPDLTALVDTRGDLVVQQARLYAARAAEALFIEARAHGHTNIAVTSGYRSYQEQVSIFNNNVEQLISVGVDREEAIQRTAFAIAHPGQSEHQSGLAIDILSPVGFTQAFGSHPDGMWLAQNAHHFGFIVRYPEGKEHITGIQYEPWHFRYVGRFHATQIYMRNLTLEEYHEQVLR
jgi:LAS superfamily LD-carboxypeptidase LdcB